MKAKDLMIPASECARVAQDRTIYDAVVMLEASRQRSQLEYRPRFVLVHDKDFRIIGGMEHADMLRALASDLIPTCGTQITTSDSPGAEAPPSAAGQATVWGEILSHLYEIAHRVQVKDAMHLYHEAQYIDENAFLEEVVCRLLSGPYLNLVLMSGTVTIGIVRMSDVFNRLCKEIKRSGMK